MLQVSLKILSSTPLPGFITYLADALNEIIGQGIVISDEPDKSYWDLSYCCKFSFSSARELIGQKQPKSSLVTNYWNKYIPLKVSLLMYNDISTNLVVQNKEILFCSKCYCCTNVPSIEYNNHLFHSSGIGREIWPFFLI